MSSLNSSTALRFLVMVPCTCFATVARLSHLLLALIFWPPFWSLSLLLIALLPLLIALALSLTAATSLPAAAGPPPAAAAAIAEPGGPVIDDEADGNEGDREDDKDANG